MSLDDTISTDSIKEKLRNLRDYLPRKEEIVYELGKYVADNLGSETTPRRFVSAYGIAQMDLVRAKTSGEQKPRTIWDAKDVLDKLLGTVTSVAEAVCPKYFAEEIKKIFNR